MKIAVVVILATILSVHGQDWLKWDNKYYHRLVSSWTPEAMTTCPATPEFEQKVSGPHCSWECQPFDELRLTILENLDQFNKCDNSRVGYEKLHHWWNDRLVELVTNYTCLHMVGDKPYMCGSSALAISLMNDKVITCFDETRPRVPEIEKAGILGCEAAYTVPFPEQQFVQYEEKKNHAILLLDIELQETAVHARVLEMTAARFSRMETKLADRIEKLQERLESEGQQLSQTQDQAQIDLYEADIAKIQADLDYAQEAKANYTGSIQRRLQRVQNKRTWILEKRAIGIAEIEEKYAPVARIGMNLTEAPTNVSRSSFFDNFDFCEPRCQYSHISSPVSFIPGCSHVCMSNFCVPNHHFLTLLCFEETVKRNYTDKSCYRIGTWREYCYDLRNLDYTTWD